MLTFAPPWPSFCLLTLLIGKGNGVLLGVELHLQGLHVISTIN